jgi:hypothetical protein
LHEEEPVFAKRIEDEFAAFWARVGPQEFPEIEDYPFAFAASYCSKTRRQMSLLQTK